MRTNMSEDKRIVDAVRQKLTTVVDPEIGVPITEMNLVDEVKAEGGNVLVTFHLTMPLCPPIFALQISKDIKEKAKSVEGVRSVRVNLIKHVNAEEINKEVNE